MPPALLPGRWALTPPFHPYRRHEPFEDVPKVFLRAITGLRAAGGIFSVALSVNSSTGFSLCLFPRRHVSRFVPPNKHRLKSVLPLPWRYQAHCPFSARAEWCPDFPPARSAFAFQASDRPAHPPVPLYRERPARWRNRVHERRRSNRDCGSGNRQTEAVPAWVQRSIIALILGL
jgi:hypothetical protein